MLRPLEFDALLEEALKKLADQLLLPAFVFRLEVVPVTKDALAL